MRRLGFAAVALLLAAPLSAAQPRGDAATAEAETMLRCAGWAAIHAGQATDESQKSAFTDVLTWFIGRYEGATGRQFDTVLTAGDIESATGDISALNQLCLPLMLDIGERMEKWGERMQDRAAAAAPPAG